MEINDLRSAIAMLKQMDHQLIETDIEVDPNAELAGVYRHVGAGGTVMRPTTIDGPAMLFHNIKGHTDASVLIGLLASRKRVAALLGCQKEELGKLLCKLTGGKINPLIGSAGVSAVPMAARVSQKVGSEYDPTNFLLMHAMGPNVAGVIGTAVAAGTFMAIFGV